jgi:Gpi18-like mannosyltransferase
MKANILCTTITPIILPAGVRSRHKMLPKDFFKNRSNFYFAFLASVAGLLRLYLAPHTYHLYDVKAWCNDARQIMVRGHVFDFYHSTDYAYPPLWSWFIALAYILHPTLNYKDEIFLILIKFPMILSDLVIGFLIYLFVGQRFDKTKGLLASIMWLFNPHIIYIGSMWGMNDSLCVVFIVASLYLLTQEKFLLSSFMLGLAISAKQYAVLVVPFLALAVLKKYDTKKGLAFLLVPFAVLALVSIPYLIYDREAYISQILYGIGEQQLEIRQNCGTFWYCLNSLFRGDLNSHAFFVNLQYPVFFGIYAVSLAVFNTVTRKIGDKALNNAILISTLVFLVFSPVVHAQYYVLFIPFTIIASFYKRLKPLWYAVTVLPFYSFFSIGVWVDKTEIMLYQSIGWMNSAFSALACDSLRPFKLALLFALFALIASSYLELWKP